MNVIHMPWSQVACPIVYGSISSALAAPATAAGAGGGGRRAGASGGASSSSADQATHRWTCESALLLCLLVFIAAEIVLIITVIYPVYLRGPVGDEDLSCFVSKVAFLLHPSFPEPVRGAPRPMKLPVCS
jgi:hypothetical protein